MAKIVIGMRKKELRRSLVQKWKRRHAATMPWSLCQEQWVWERATAPSEANKVCGRLEKGPHSVQFKTALIFSNSFNVVCTLCPPHTFHTLLHMHDRQSQKHIPHLLTNPCVLIQRSLRCMRAAYTLWTRRPSTRWVILFPFFYKLEAS